jgi:hypothetical protein
MTPMYVLFILCFLAILLYKHQLTSARRSNVFISTFYRCTWSKVVGIGGRWVRRWLGESVLLSQPIGQRFMEKKVDRFGQEDYLIFRALKPTANAVTVRPQLYVNLFTERG